MTQPSTSDTSTCKAVAILAYGRSCPTCLYARDARVNRRILRFNCVRSSSGEDRVGESMVMGLRR
jgi:hypothetical protein